MNAKRFKSNCKRLFALVLATALLSGCTKKSEVPGQLILSEGIPPALSRDENRESSFEAKLYFVSEDGRNLSAETRTVNCDGSMSRAEAAIRAMQDGPVSDALQDSVPHSVQFSHLDLSTDACNVYFTGEFEETDEIREWLTLRAAVSATVYAAENIGTVNVYLNGMVPGYQGKALGALAPIQGALDTYLSDLKQRYEVLAQEQTEAGARESNTITLYFANMDDTLLIARNRKIPYDLALGKAGIVKALISELLQGDIGTKGLEPVLPADLELAQEPSVVYLSDLQKEAAFSASSETEPQGSPSPDPNVQEPLVQDRDEPCIIELVLVPPTMEYNEQMMCGAITLMLTGYLPKVVGVKISIVETSQSGVETLRNLSEGDYFTREEFSGLIGRSVYLAYPDAEGAVLDRVERVVASASVYDPDARLAELFKGPADPGVMYALFSEQNIKDVYIVGDLAVVNWNAGFTEKLKKLAETEQMYTAGGSQEVLFVFGVINTLTEIPGVERVWMLEDGQKLGMVENLYLGNALLRNPGILINVTN